MDEILSIRSSPMFYRSVFFRMTRFRYFAVSENVQFACNSDPNLVSWEASLFFLKLVLFRPCLASAWVKKKEDDVLQKKQGHPTAIFGKYLFGRRFEF